MISPQVFLYPPGCPDPPVKNVVPSLFHDYDKIESEMPLFIRKNNKFSINNRRAARDRPVPCPVMAGGIPEISTRVVRTIVHKFEPAPGDRDDPAKGLSWNPSEVDLNNVPLLKYEGPAGFALVNGIPNSGHRVPDWHGCIDRNKDPGIRITFE